MRFSRRPSRSFRAAPAQLGHARRPAQGLEVEELQEGDDAVPEREAGELPKFGRGAFS